MGRWTCFLLCLTSPLFTQQAYRVDPNVVYGMYSGLALLMDVYRPAAPNGFAVIYISGSGWHAPQEYNAAPLKESPQAKLYAVKLAEAGYTVFAISHRAAPRFRYPAAVEDAQRAVRFVRHNASRFGIRADRIGAVGGSSGGHLVSMLGVLDGKGDPESPDPVERVSAKVQCVVARAAPADMARMTSGGGGNAVTSFLGMLTPQPNEKASIEARTFRLASPLTHVTADDPPMLLLHGDADTVVPFEQAELMEKGLRAAGVAVRLLRAPGGGHGPTFGGAQNPPDYMGEMRAWLNK
jgi:acetyl esterase/lipase